VLVNFNPAAAKLQEISSPPLENSRESDLCDVPWIIHAGGDVAAMVLAGFSFKPSGRLNRAGHPRIAGFGGFIGLLGL
jgi:hypothetical protein